MSELEWAKAEITARTDHTNTAKAFQLLADASANLALRPDLQNGVFFEELLSSLLDVSVSSKTSFDPDLLRNILRCVGNLVADNERGRSLVISSPDCLDALSGLLVSDSAGSDVTVVAHTAIKVIFNLCNDYTPAQQKCFEQNIHESLIYCLDRRPPTDEGIWALALDLVAMLLEHKRELRPSEDYPNFSSNAPKLLKLPLAEFDPTAFFDALTVVVAYFQDENFLKAAVDHKYMHLVWDILKRVEERTSVDREVEDEEDYEEKQYLQFQLLFSQTLADMSSLPLFNEKYDSSDAFIESLVPQIIPSGDAQSRSPIPPTACLIIGNLITSDADAVDLIPQIPVKELFSEIGRSNDTAFLNAASGLLRHLATPAQNREKHFADTEYVRLSQHLYTNISLEQVQVGGLALTRQMLVGMKSKVISLLTQDDTNFLSTLLTTYQTTTSTSIKLEMTRLVVTLLRTLQPDSSSSTIVPPETAAVEALLDTPVNLPSILDPILFSIKHAPEPSIVAVQAEAWLGLNLLVRLPGGVTKAAVAVAEDAEVFSLFSSRLAHTHGETAQQGEEESKDSRPAWLKEKERDNAVLLTADILKADGVDEETKRKFRETLDEEDIVVR